MPPSIILFHISCSFFLWWVVSSSHRTVQQKHLHTSAINVHFDRSTLHLMQEQNSTVFGVKTSKFSPFEVNFKCTIRNSFHDGCCCSLFDDVTNWLVRPPKMYEHELCSRHWWFHQISARLLRFSALLVSMVKFIWFYDRFSMTECAKHQIDLFTGANITDNIGKTLFFYYTHRILPERAHQLLMQLFHSAVCLSKKTQFSLWWIYMVGLLIDVRNVIKTRVIGVCVAVFCTLWDGFIFF